MNMTHPNILETEAMGMPEQPAPEPLRCELCDERELEKQLAECIKCYRLACPACTATKNMAQGDEFSASCNVCNECLDDLLEL